MRVMINSIIYIYILISNLIITDILKFFIYINYSIGKKCTIQCFNILYVLYIFLLHMKDDLHIRTIGSYNQCKISILINN